MGSSPIGPSRIIQKQEFTTPVFFSTIAFMNKPTKKTNQSLINKLYGFAIIFLIIYAAVMTYILVDYMGARLDLEEAQVNDDLGRMAETNERLDRIEAKLENN